MRKIFEEEDNSAMEALTLTEQKLLNEILEKMCKK